MSMPKEPRQKMINMMYLVLTALLALNVSAEILNAFKIVDKSLLRSNTELGHASTELYKSLSIQLSNPQTMKKASVWQPVADKVGQLSNALYAKLEDYKGRLRMEANASSSTDTRFREDNLDAATRLFVTKQEGEKLFNAVAAYKQDVLTQHPELKAAFEKSFPFQLEGKASDWAVTQFRMVPAIAALTILSKMQNDLRNTELQVVTWCHNKIEKTEVPPDKYASFVSQSSEYLMPGQQLRIRAAVGGFSTDPKVATVVTVNGQTVPVNSDGFAEMPLDGGATGTHSAQVKVAYTNQDGERLEDTKTVTWEVGSPGAVSVSPDKMNMLYVNVNNPLTISAGVGLDKIESVSINNGSISGSGAKWTARPAEESDATMITVKADGKITQVPFRVRSLPPASAFVGEVKGGTMRAASFKAMKGVSARLEHIAFQEPYQVVSYEIMAYGANTGGSNPRAVNQGPTWTGTAAEIANRAVPGTNYIISNITVLGPDGKKRLASNPTIVINCN
jgi:gliding motility-associated protein GldM